MDCNYLDQLTCVAKTLIFPLVARAEFSKADDSPINDKFAIQLLEDLEYNSSQLIRKVGRYSMLWCMARTYHFNQVIKSYLSVYPKATIVNIGAGLDTTFYNIDNGQLVWVDIDLPKVITLKKQLLPQAPNIIYISRSIFDCKCIEELKIISGSNVLFMAGGIFMYYSKNSIRFLLKRLGRNFHSQIIFDVPSKNSVIYTNKLFTKINYFADAKLKWGIDNSEEFITWSDRIKIISTKKYFQDIKFKYNFSLSYHMYMLFCDLYDKGRIFHMHL